MPSNHASAQEIVALCAVLAEFDRGAIEFIPRSLAEGYDEADRALILDMYRASGKPIELNVLTPTPEHPLGWQQILDFVQEAAAEGVRIYTIGIGDDRAGAPGLFGLPRRPGTDLDETTLKGIAEKTGGRYFRARNVSSLQEIYALIDDIEPLSEDRQSYRPVDELYAWPLAIALFSSLLLTGPLWSGAMRPYAQRRRDA